MRLIKFLLVIAILFITAMYYNVFTFDRGLVKDAKDAGTSDIASLKDVESVKLGDKYYVFYLTEDDTFVEKFSEDDYKIMDAIMDIEEKSIVPGVAAVGASLAILIFVRGRRN